LVSVMIRTKDRYHLLREAIETVACQTYPNIELVVVNDGGEDVSELIEYFSNTIARMNYINLKENNGRAEAANICIDKTTGDYLIFLDDDDLFDPDHIKRLLYALRNNSSYKAAYTDILVTGKLKDFYLDYPYEPARLKIENYIPIHAIMFEKSLVKKGGRFNKKLFLYEDWDFLLQLSSFTSFLHVKGVSATYRNLGFSGY